MHVIVSAAFVANKRILYNIELYDMQCHYFIRGYQLDYISV